MVFTGYACGARIYLVGHVISEVDHRLSPILLRFGRCCFMAIFSVPAIGGFVVVSKMLKAYGICHKFV